jgi:hypothetical protein
MKKDWEQIGRELRDEWMALVAELERQPPPEPAPVEVTALAAAVAEIREHGKWSRLIDYLRSDHPLNRHLLALFLEYAKAPIGRQPKLGMRFLADAADTFYREWKSRNKREGINDRGLSDIMKYQSCQYLIEVDGASLMDEGEIPDAEALVQLLNRPKSRRKLKD